MTNSIQRKLNSISDPELKELAEDLFKEYLALAHLTNLWAKTALVMGVYLCLFLLLLTSVIAPVQDVSSALIRAGLLLALAYMISYDRLGRKYGFSEEQEKIKRRVIFFYSRKPRLYQAIRALREIKLNHAADTLYDILQKHHQGQE